MVTGKRILVVEDETVISMMVEDTLREAGAEIVAAANVEDALHLIDTCQFDAAVLDCLLDNKQVFPVADRLARLGVPFLFATGYGEHCDKGQHTTAGVLSKPFVAEGLVTAVASLFPPLRPS